MIEEPAPTKRELQKEERRKQILAAALKVFSEKGYHAANVSDVAAEAGVSQGTIYWYFESKEELARAAILSVFDEWGQEAMEAILAQPTARGKLEALFRGIESLGEQMDGLFMLFLGYWASSPDRAQAGQWWLDLLLEYKSIVAGIIAEGVQNGEFRTVDPEALAWSLLATYDGLAAYGMLVPDLDLVRTSRAFAETVLRGLEVDS